MDLHSSPPLFERIIHYDEVKEIQVRLVVSEFRGTEYLHLRKYYLDFDENWLPSPEGIAFPIDLANSRELFEGLLEILSLAESKTLLEDHFKDILDKIY